MTGISIFIYSDDYLKYQFGPTHPMQPIRQKYTFDLLKKVGAFDKNIRHYEPKPAREDELQLVHSKDYIDFVKRASLIGGVLLDGGDTPAVKGIYEGACSVVGGSICGANLLISGEATHAFNPGGGLHHAKADAASGFCVFNDIAIATRILQKKGYERIVILDVDGHHADGTQQILYSEPILKISLHRSGVFFFPGTGFVEEIGEGEGKGYSVNIPLPPRTDDESYLFAFDQVVIPLIRAYRPQIILNQFGVDGHYEDPLVGLSLTTRTFSSIAATIHNLSHELCQGKCLLFGGGGYEPANTARCWALVFLIISEAASQEELSKLSDTFRPPRDSRVAEEVRRTVDKVRRLIFPYHNLAP